MDLLFREFWLAGIDPRPYPVAYAAGLAAAALLGGGLLTFVVDQPMQSLFRRVLRPKPKPRPA